MTAPVSFAMTIFNHSAADTYMPLNPTGAGVVCRLGCDGIGPSNGYNVVPHRADGERSAAEIRLHWSASLRANGPGAQKAG